MLAQLFATYVIVWCRRSTNSSDVLWQLQCSRIFCTCFDGACVMKSSLSAWKINATSLQSTKKISLDPGHLSK